MLSKKPGTIIESLLANGLSLIAIRGSILISSAVVTILLVRYLGAEGFGSYAAASSIYAVFLPFALFGLGNVITREIAKKTALAWEYFSTALCVGLGLAAVSTGAIVLFSLYAGYPEAVSQAALILAIGLYPNFIIQISESLFIGLEKVRYFALANAIAEATEIALMVFFLTHGYKLFAVVTALVAVRFCFSTALVFLVIRLTGKRRLVFDARFALRFLKVSSVFAAAGILAGLLFKIDVLFLSRLAGLGATGIYSAAYKVVNLWAMLITSFIGVFYPIASKYRDQSPEKFEEISQLMLRGVLVTVFFAILATLAFSRELVLILFDAQFEASVGVLRELIFLLIPLCATPLLGLFLAASHLQKFDFVAIATAAVSSFILHATLVPRLGCYGSVYASILTFSIILIIQLYFVNRWVFKIRYLENVAKPTAAFAVSCALLFAADGCAWYWKAPAAWAVFIGLLAMFQSVRRRDVELLSHAC